LEPSRSNAIKISAGKKIVTFIEALMWLVAVLRRRKRSPGTMGTDDEDSKNESMPFEKRKFSRDLEHWIGLLLLQRMILETVRGAHVKHRATQGVEEV
jgi:hypothetical protein